MSENTYPFKMLYLNELSGTGMKDKLESLFCFGATHLQPPVSVCVCFVCVLCAFCMY